MPFNRRKLFVSPEVHNTCHRQSLLVKVLLLLTIYVSYTLQCLDVKHTCKGLQLAKCFQCKYYSYSSVCASCPHYGTVCFVGYDGVDVNINKETLISPTRCTGRSEVIAECIRWMKPQTDFPAFFVSKFTRTRSRERPPTSPSSGVLDAQLGLQVWKLTSVFESRYHPSAFLQYQGSLDKMICSKPLSIT